MNFRFTLLLIFAVFCSTLAQDTPDPNVDIPESLDVESERTNSTTTTTPPPTTTTTPPTTTTSTTTTSESTTTTEATTTSPKTTIPTTEAPTTPTPPAANYLYNVTENNITCIMLDGKLSFKIEYSIEGSANKTNTSIVELPKPSNIINVTGTCSANSQYIEITWGRGLSNIRITFEEAKDQKTWKIANFTSAIYLDQSIFINATDSGQVLDSEVSWLTTPADIPVNGSLKCYSSQTFNTTTTMQNVTYIYSVRFLIEELQIQAFNLLSHKDNFAEEVHCDLDKIADVVPIAVGCALAALVVIVLIAYIVGRRRRSAAYQSV